LHAANAQEARRVWLVGAAQVARWRPGTGPAAAEAAPPRLQRALRGRLASEVDGPSPASSARSTYTDL